jgi:hypothetical protein
MGIATLVLPRLLHLSSYTVKDHMKSIFDKVGVRSHAGWLPMPGGQPPTHIASPTRRLGPHEAALPGHRVKPDRAGSRIPSAWARGAGNCAYGRL